VLLTLSCGSSEGFRVPLGLPITLDGTLDEREWSDTVAVDLRNGGEAFLKHDGDHLYLGIRGPEMGWAHVCVGDAGRVSVLHSSAALGTAEYVPADSGLFQAIRGFEWTMRDTSLTDGARNARREFLKQEEWVASTAWMGEPFEREFILKLAIFGEAKARLTVLYASDEESPSFYYWPNTLSDESLNLELVWGRTPGGLHFDLRQWAVLKLDDGL
jgi:hypothetical protein